MVIYIDYKFCTNGTFKLIHLEELNCKEVGLYEYVGHEKIKVNDKSDTIEIAANFLAKLLCRNIDVDPRYYWVLENLYELIDSLVDFIRMYKSGNVVQRKYLMSPGDKSAITVRIEEEWQMNKLYPSDFNVSESNPNGVWVRLNEINEMIDFEVLQVDEDKLQEYCNLRIMEATKW